MNEKQLANHIGEIEDVLVEQAQTVPNYAARKQKERKRRMISIAASIVLMLSSFTVGATAFAREIIVEVPANQETLVLEGANLTMILPDNWAGQYAIQCDGQDNYIIYSSQIRERGEYGGALFYIVCYNEPMTETQFLADGLDFTSYRYLFATEDKTYIFYNVSDVQYDFNDAEQVRLYEELIQSVDEIQFIVHDLLKEK